MITELTRQEFEDALEKEKVELLVVWNALEGNAPQTCGKLRSIRTNGVIRFVWETPPSDKDIQAIQEVMEDFPWVWNSTPFFA